METGVFGFAVPYGVLHAVGVLPRDVTLQPAPTGTPADSCIEPFIEPFMDPFAAAVLRNLAAGAFADMRTLVFLRESPGAVHACHYAGELRRRGVLRSGPVPFLLNLVPASDPAAHRFNLTELTRLNQVVPPGEIAAPYAGFKTLLRLQADARISGAEAFRLRADIAGGHPIRVAPAAADDRPRLALLGAPLGNDTLHRALDRTGALVFDQQAADQCRAARGRGLDQALAAQAANPFSARQPRPLYLAALRDSLTALKIDRAVWQVDPHDDLWGWLAPGVRTLCRDLGIAFTDLGFLPRWPAPQDLAGRSLAGGAV